MEGAAFLRLSRKRKQKQKEPEAQRVDTNVIIMKMKAHVYFLLLLPDESDLVKLAAVLFQHPHFSKINSVWRLPDLSPPLGPLLY